MMLLYSVFEETKRNFMKEIMNFCPSNLDHLPHQMRNYRREIKAWNWSKERRLNVICCILDPKIRQEGEGIISTLHTRCQDQDRGKTQNTIIHTFVIKFKSGEELRVNC